MNKKLHFFQSIHFKIALVFALLLFLAFQIVGAIFVQRLKSENLKQFKQSVEIPAYVNSLLVTQLNEANTTEANNSIRNIIDDINNSNISYIQVVDAKGVIRGENNANNRSTIGQKVTDTSIRQVLYSGRNFTQTMYNERDNRRYYISITPLFNTSGNNNTVVGAIYVRANLENVYDSVNSVIVIFATAALIATAIGLALAILVSNAITRPIDEMKKQNKDRAWRLFGAC